MRERYRQFVEQFIIELQDADAETAAQRAADKAWDSGYHTSQKSRLRRAKKVLESVEAVYMLRDYFEIAADLTPVEAGEWLAKHIRGEIETESVAVSDGPDGRKVTTTKAKVAPSLPALRQYMDLAIPKPPKQVQVDQRTLVTRVNLSEAPRTRARVLETGASDAKPALPPAEGST